jgi:hypothetical protein
METLLIELARKTREIREKGKVIGLRLAAWARGASADASSLAAAAVLAAAALASQELPGRTSRPVRRPHRGLQEMANLEPGQVR